jgi:hypothetical protein
VVRFVDGDTIHVEVGGRREKDRGELGRCTSSP